MGLRGNDGKHRKSFDSFKTMTGQLGALRLAQHLIGAGHLSSGVQAYEFQSATNSKLVLWNIDGEITYLAKRNGNVPVRIFDVQGQSLPVKYAKDGRVQLPLSQAPIYISGVSGDALQPAPPPVAATPVYLFPKSE